MSSSASSSDVRLSGLASLGSGRDYREAILQKQEGTLVEAIGEVSQKYGDEEDQRYVPPDGPEMPPDVEEGRREEAPTWICEDEVVDERMVDVEAE